MTSPSIFKATVPRTGLLCLPTFFLSSFFLSHFSTPIVHSNLRMPVSLITSLLHPASLSECNQSHLPGFLITTMSSKNDENLSAKKRRHSTDMSLDERKVDETYNDTSADCILISSDDVRFYVDCYHLVSARRVT